MKPPYYSDAMVELHVGDCREVLPALGRRFDAVIADPSYEETALRWDRWADGWPAVVAAAASSMWCFGSIRMFGERWPELTADWKLSQDVIGYDEDGQPVYGDVRVVWEKHNGSNFAADRFRRVHEQATHWYRGRWADVRHEVPTTADAVAKQVRRSGQPAHTGLVRPSSYETVNGGPRLMRSVLRVRSMHGRAIHPCEKPVGLLAPLIEYACPAGGTVLDPFAGSGATAVAATMSGRRAVLIEANEAYAEKIARRLAQDVLPIGGVS